jgi:predicted cation transporter
MNDATMIASLIAPVLVSLSIRILLLFRLCSLVVSKGRLMMGGDVPDSK